MIFVDKKTSLIFLLFSLNVFSQNSLKMQYDLGLELFYQEKYFDAITEFKRLRFFDTQKLYAFESNLFLGKSYKAGGKFNDAARYFTIAEINSRNDQEYFASRILIARTNILRRTTKQAANILTELEKDLRFNSSKKEINYWQGWNCMFSDEWEMAYEIFKENDLDTTLAKLCNLVVEARYNENFAKYSSYLIPGLGQFYTGEYLSGVLSLGWNVLFGYLTINSFVKDRVLDGILVGNLLWLRFYSGNIQNAEKFALQKNLQFSNQALDYLENQFEGKKP